MSARPGRVSSWLSAFADSETSSAPETRARAHERDERDPDELEHAGRAPRAQVLAEAPLLPAPAVVGEADRGDQRLVERHGPADERQARAAVVHAQGARGEQRVEQLAPAVEEAARVAAGGTVIAGRAPPPRRGRRRVPRRSSSASRRRSRARAGTRRPARTATARAGRRAAPRASKPRAQPDQRARDALRDPEAAPLAFGEHRDPQPL